MSTVEIHASFQDEQSAMEALHKLQALRVVDVYGLHENGRLTATIEDEVADRAMRLIEQVGGSITSGQLE
ncbi:hypothetical protein D3P07_06465 [Paenibacillus sp. 1011MAR3C5]|uniref:hypothetical protein n=1 Tax=Paenibacillus sp. 1011MAR3C5 TaxID=1675787 RepID=UPI000E6C6034|nr:hypothetical protein [Paenibacillus sp. 1011MAR3C5]RJE89865.1 hypothetical protein D3P07_06465 [Paenibacillus sp. 1011MAR3C5]